MNQLEGWSWVVNCGMGPWIGWDGHMAHWALALEDKYEIWTSQTLLEKQVRTSAKRIKWK